MRTKKGIITSAKMTGTVTVTVHRAALHPKYKKSFRISKKYLVDPNGHDNLVEGDQVLIGECKPISKNKCFKVVEILKKVADVSELQEEEGLEQAIHREKKGKEVVEGIEGKEVAEEKEQSNKKDKEDSDASNNDSTS